MNCCGLAYIFASVSNNILTICIQYVGYFEMLSLSGSYQPSETDGMSSGTCGLSVSLASLDGRIFGGRVAGPLTAASPVQVTQF
jgi:hypothetical protein